MNRAKELWQDRFGLNSWVILVSFASGSEMRNADGDRDTGQCRPFVERRLAEIQIIREEDFQEDPVFPEGWKPERFLIHELLEVCVAELEARLIKESVDETAKEQFVNSLEGAFWGLKIENDELKHHLSPSSDTKGKVGKPRDTRHEK